MAAATPPEAIQASSVADPRPFRTGVTVAVVLLLLVVGVAGLKGWRDLQTARGQERRLAGEIAAARENIRALEERVRLLDDDPATLERLAREELWMARPDDVVIVLPGDDGEPAARAAGGEAAPEAVPIEER